MSGWCDKNDLVLNCNKTKIVHFSKSSNVNYSLYVRSPSQSVPVVQSVGFLGLALDRHLRWDDHCRELATKLRSSLFGMNTLRKCVTMYSLKSFYYAQVESRLRYAIIFWGSSTGFWDIFILQKRIIRSMLGATYNTPCQQLFRTLGILTLPSLYIYELIMFLFDNQATDYAYEG